MLESKDITQETLAIACSDLLGKVVKREQVVSVCDEADTAMRRAGSVLKGCLRVATVEAIVNFVISDGGSELLENESIRTHFHQALGVHTAIMRPDRREALSAEIARVAAARIHQDGELVIRPEDWPLLGLLELLRSPEKSVVIPLPLHEDS